eukprot:TRINITY_DN4402_c0_g1_i21.p1 TRINITY_DN4402_c0_g1~~TRINITY_DN4402_c0_g1_i21.p1  ORF type:complete len:348 (-),score=51.00 TRINITY_DN4402_c0_g1_i21:569-1612(-)
MASKQVLLDQLKPSIEILIQVLKELRAHTESAQVGGSVLEQDFVMQRFRSVTLVQQEWKKITAEKCYAAAYYVDWQFTTAIKSLGLALLKGMQDPTSLPEVEKELYEFCNHPSVFLSTVQADDFSVPFGSPLHAPSVTPEANVPPIHQADNTDPKPVADTQFPRTWIVETSPVTNRSKPVQQIGPFGRKRNNRVSAKYRKSRIYFSDGTSSSSESDSENSTKKQNSISAKSTKGTGKDLSDRSSSSEEASDNEDRISPKQSRTLNRIPSGITRSHSQSKSLSSCPIREETKRSSRQEKESSSDSSDEEGRCGSANRKYFPRFLKRSARTWKNSGSCIISTNIRNFRL